MLKRLLIVLVSVLLLLPQRNPQTKSLTLAARHS
jgi:hypothetical protein